MQYVQTLFVVLSVGVMIIQCQKEGGMAELKSITGDAPYDGVGNAPAPIPQPMGFWGRPRYSPPGHGFDGPYGGPMMGGGGPFPYSPYNRFTSMSSSPYGLGTWYNNLQ
ncbi:uncharacterized protein CELE_F45E4.5 [Caenorhabditis elegans]|uniref:Secreted protein n=2 Tax=Caenorhabditis elegans TaxID=6239 RepID=Q94228_CAEEL|nr:Secreted protein [Caenorhabditis elegans]CCD63789.1 Secreted protein [Caenorhabditis elegans]|eukprot:NP_501239.3 Uncharacterized protein CELE_F45E4.5 [Caenorhabditis elegans]